MLKQIGKYTISERIGRGIYSCIYRAVDSQGHPVAIKVSTTQTEPQHLTEFQKDLVAAASVLHPNLVAVHDLGFEDDFPYLVMELVEGRDLNKLLKSRPAPSLAERIRIMQQVGEALKSAHERGVFHLDVRPSKIILGDDGAAKLLDLGLGRLSFDPARMTENGYLIGAPFYMSPERLTAIDTADERCDIWSFGVTFYEWLSGRHPFYDDDGDRMIGNIMDATPAPLSKVRAPLNQVILRALAKDPSARYQNFAELLSDLKPMVNDLKREENDALMAEALKETNSGRWHEAQRIARKLRDFEPQQGPSSRVFGFSKQEMQRERQAERVRAAPRPIMQPAAASVGTASAVAATVDTPEPAPTPVLQRPSVERSAAIQPPRPTTPTPKPQRPERTAPKIPPMGVRNGASTKPTNESGSAASVRLKAPVSGTNGAARMAAAASAGAASAASSIAASAKPAVVGEADGAAETEPARTRPASSQRSAPPRPPRPRPSVRILKMEEPNGLPWVKILMFAIPALLMFGALPFFLQPTSKALKSRRSYEDAKEVRRASRVIVGDRVDPPVPKTSANIGPAAASSPAPVMNAQPDASATPPATGPLDPAPRAFDPKSLAPAKAGAPPRRRDNGALAGLAPPKLGNSGDSTNAPVALNAPPPPAAAVAPVPDQATPVPAASSSAPETVPNAHETPSRVGGVFAPPVLIHTVQPTYPPSAVQIKAQGMVRFQATIAKDGSVKDIQLVSGDPLLNGAAKQAVLQWKYHPATSNGEPVEVTQAIIVKFNLDNQ